MAATDILDLVLLSDNTHCMSLSKFENSKASNLSNHFSSSFKFSIVEIIIKNAEKNVFCFCNGGFEKLNDPFQKFLWSGTNCVVYNW